MTTIVKRNLKQHEEIIADGMKSFLYVGQSLMAIRDERLYAEHYDTFEAYCQKRWQFGKSRAYQLIEAAEVQSDLSTIVDAKTKNSKQKTAIPLPQNEAQARAVAESADTPEQRRQVWEKVIETAPKNEAGEPIITAKFVSKVADEVVGPKNDKPKQVEGTVEPPKAEYRPGFDPRQFDPEMREDQPAGDETEAEPSGDVPKHLVEVVAGIKEYESFRRELSMLKSKVESLIKMPIGAYIRWQDVEMHIDQLKADFRVASFGDNCPDCKNKPDAKCLRCKGRGWIAQGQMGSLSDEHKAWLKTNSVKA